jgi:regulator of nonsense transcripts 2
MRFYKYYIHTKYPLPLDIEFLVLDTFALTRPQWKFVEDIEEATKAFQLAISQDQKTAGVDKVIEADDATSGPSSEDENGDMDDVEADGDGDDESASEEEEDAEVRYSPRSFT